MLLLLVCALVFPWGETVGGFGSRWLQESECITAITELLLPHIKDQSFRFLHLWVSFCPSLSLLRHEKAPPPWFVRKRGYHLFSQIKTGGASVLHNISAFQWRWQWEGLIMWNKSLGRDLDSTAVTLPYSTLVTTLQSQRVLQKLYTHYQAWLMQQWGKSRKYHAEKAYHYFKAHYGVLDAHSGLKKYFYWCCFT